MGLTGKLEAATEYKAGGDTFHRLFRHKPQRVSEATPGRVQACDLHEGQFGQVGSILLWKYVHDGQNRVAKTVVQKIAEEKKLIEFKIFEGDMMEKYKTFYVTCHVQESAKKRGIELVTWTLEYEKLKEDVEDPISFLAFFIELTKDVEARGHHVIEKP